MPIRFVVVAMVVLSGCLLPAPPAAPRYFAPPEPAPSARPATPPPLDVRLAPVRSPLYLREAMAWRRSEVEYGFYDQRRWTELPSTYVGRALAGALFPAGPDPSGSPAGVPLVAAEVRAFEEVLGPVHEARVEVAVEVADRRCVLLRRSFAATRPLDGDDPAAVARGIGEALDEVSGAAAEAIRGAVVGRRRCAA